MNTIYGRLGGASAVDTTDRELMQQALKALSKSDYFTWRTITPLIEALRARLAQPERQWQGLTDDEIVLIVADCAATHRNDDVSFARAIEAKLKEKNT